MAFKWLEDYKKLEAGRKQKSRVTVPDQLFGERYKAGTPGNGNGQRDKMGGREMPNGRFTGLGGDNKLQSDMPTAMQKYTEHEGEYVIPAATVQDMGGPENVDSTIKQLKMKATESNQQLAGYQDGGEVTAEKIKKTAAEFEPAPLDVAGVQKAPTAEAAKFGGQFAGATDILEKRAEGEAPELEKIAQVSREKLAGKQAAEEGAMRQTLAQTTKGAPGGAVNALMAINRAAQEGQVTELERGIFETKVNEASQATRDLVSASMQGMSFEENKRQFGEQMAMDVERFNEDRRQYGVDVAMNMEQTNHNRVTAMANQQLAAGDFEGAAKTWDKLGVKVDYSGMIDERDASTVNQGLSDLAGHIAAGLDATNPVVENNMKSVYSTLNPDDTEMSGYDAWKDDTYGALKTKSDPISSVMSTMSDDTIESMFRGWSVGSGVDFNMENINYNGQSGSEGLRDALTDMFSSQVLSVAENGSVNPPGDLDDPAFTKYMEKLGILEPTAAPGVPEGLESLKSALVAPKYVPEAKAASPGSGFVTADGKQMYKSTDGSSYKATKPEVVPGLRISRNEPRYNDGTAWRSVGVGDVVVFDKSMDTGIPGEKEMPQGAYTVQREDGVSYWVNVDTKQKFEIGREGSSGARK